MATISSISNQISYRDAQARAQKLRDSTFTRDLYLKAIENGDDNLALAIQEVSADKGWALVTTDFSATATAANDGFVALAADHYAAVRVIQAQRDAGLITDKGAQDQFDRAAKTNDWAGELDAIVAKATIPINTARNAEAMAISRLTTPKGDTNDQLLAEMRLTKAWDRVKNEVKTPIKAGAIPVAALCRKLEAAIDPYEIAAIITEGPSWLLSKGESDGTDLINATLAHIDPLVGNAIAGATSAGRFEATLLYDARVVRQIITTYTLTSSDLKAEGYVDLTTISY